MFISYPAYSWFSGSAVAISIILLALIVISIAGEWKLIAKTGKPGWSAIVPFYASYCQFSVFWGCGWLFLVPLVLGCLYHIPYIGSIAAILVIIITVLHEHKKALAFGKSIGFTFGLIFLPFIFNCILGFGDAKYLGVPQDGTSYKQIRNVLGLAEEKEKNMKFEEPPRDEEIHVEYEQPEQTQEKAEEPCASVEPAKVVEVDLTDETKDEKPEEK